MYADRRVREFWLLAVFFALFVLFLYGPFGGLTFPLNGVSLHWFRKLTEQQAVGDFGGAFRRAAAAERKTPADTARLKAHLAKERRHMSERGPKVRRAEIKASGEFHLLIAATSGNAVLLRFMEELVARCSLVIALYGRSGASSCGHDEHAMIVEALKSGAADAAQSLVLRHIDHIEADLELRAGAGLALKDALEL